MHLKMYVFNIKDRYQTKLNSFLYLKKSNRRSITNYTTKKKMRDSPFPSPLKLCFRYEYEYESHLPLIRSPRATIPSISIKMGRCLGSIMRARHFSRFPSSSSRPEQRKGSREEKEEEKKIFCLKKKKGGERSETRKTLSPWGKFAERPCRVFFALFPPGKSFRKQWPELGQLRHRDYAGRDF